MYHTIRQYLQSCIQGFHLIPEERKALLLNLSAYIRQKYINGQPVSLTFICTHNSRRSHFGQVAAALAAVYYAIDDVHSYSGGTEATALNQNALLAMQRIGLKSESDGSVKNPRYRMQYSMQDHIVCFSKIFDHPDNPHKEFAAIMTCSDADENCPFIPGAEIRIATTYEDPKKSDGSPQQDRVYDERLKQITTEVLYAFSLV
jgi:protein-tyrosine-phosphatase